MTTETNPENKDKVNDTTTTDTTTQPVDFSKIFESDEGKKFISAIIEKEVKVHKDKAETIEKKYKPIEKQLKQDEVLKLITEGKHEEVYNKIREERDNEWKTSISEKDEEITRLNEELKSFKQSKIDSVLDTNFEDQAAKSKFNQATYKVGKKMFKEDFILNEKNELEHKDKKINSKGKPYTPEDWFADLHKESPILFNSAGGSGTTKHQAPNINGKEVNIRELTNAQYKQLKKEGKIK